jgi:hypothetical protein
MRSHLLSTALRITGVLAILAACVVALLILAAPWGVYVMGLSNIDGRPTPLIGSPPTVEDDLLLRRIFRTSRPISVQPLSPWSYTLDLVMSSSSSSSSVAIPFCLDLRAALHERLNDADPEIRGEALRGLARRRDTGIASVVQHEL